MMFSHPWSRFSRPSALAFSFPVSLPVRTPPETQLLAPPSRVSHLPPFFSLFSFKTPRRLGFLFLYSLFFLFPPPRFSPPPKIGFFAPCSPFTLRCPFPPELVPKTGRSLISFPPGLLQRPVASLLLSSHEGHASFFSLPSFYLPSLISFFRGRVPRALFKPFYWIPFLFPHLVSLKFSWGQFSRTSSILHTFFFFLLFCPRFPQRISNYFHDVRFVYSSSFLLALSFGCSSCRLSSTNFSVSLGSSCRTLIPHLPPPFFFLHAPQLFFFSPHSVNGPKS